MRNLFSLWRQLLPSHLLHSLLVRCSHSLHFFSTGEFLSGYSNSCSGWILTSQVPCSRVSLNSCFFCGASNDKWLLFCCQLSSYHYLKSYYLCALLPPPWIESLMKTGSWVSFATVFLLPRTAPVPGPGRCAGNISMSEWMSSPLKSSRTLTAYGSTQRCL